MLNVLRQSGVIHSDTMDLQVLLHDTQSSNTEKLGDPLCLSVYIYILTGLRERDKREKSEEKIDCHHQDSNQGPSLVASDALTTELWCSRHPSRGRSTFFSDFVTHTSCESTQAGGMQPSL